MSDRNHRNRRKNKSSLFKNARLKFCILFKIVILLNNFKNTIKITFDFILSFSFIYCNFLFVINKEF